MKSLLPLIVFAVGCTQNSTTEQKVEITFAENSGLLLQDDDDDRREKRKTVFFGLSITLPNNQVISYNLLNGPNAIAVPRNVNLVLRARMVTSKTVAGEPVFYTSNLQMPVRISNSQNQIFLNFPAATAVPLNHIVYGQIRERQQVAQLTPDFQDPFTKSWLDTSNKYKTNSSGRFAFRLPFPENQLNVQFRNPNKSNTGPLFAANVPNSKNQIQFNFSSGTTSSPFDVTLDCVSPSLVVSGQSYTCFDGTVRVGTATTGSSAPNCNTDGQTACVATSGFPAVNATNFTSGNIKSGVSLAGVQGQYPSAAFPLSGSTSTADLTELSSNTPASTYEFFDSVGTRFQGEIADFPSTVLPAAANQTISSTSKLYRSVVVAGDANLVSSKIIAGESIFGVTGSVIVPSQSSVLAGTSFGVGQTGTLAPRPSDCLVDGSIGCVSTIGFPAASITGLAAKTILGSQVAGVAGNVTVPVVADVRQGVSFGSLLSLSGLLQAKPDDCSSDGEINCVSQSAYPAMLASGSSAKIVANQTLGGIAGTVVLPNAADVRSTASYGFNGTGVVGTLANCALDGATNCVTTSNFPSADKSTIDAFDIRKGKVIAGVPGSRKSCRNLANLGYFNESTRPFSTPGLDIYDTIDDGGDGGPFSARVSPWGDDYKCGGIYRVANGPVLNSEATWQDFTPGLKPDGSASINPALGCNSSDKICVIKDLISGITATSRVTSASGNFNSAITACENLSIPALTSSGAAVVYSDWRLPTNKEMQALSYSGYSTIIQDPTVFFSYFTSTGSSYSPLASSPSVFIAAGSIFGGLSNTSQIVKDGTNSSNFAHSICIR